MPAPVLAAQTYAKRGMDNSSYGSVKCDWKAGTSPPLSQQRETDITTKTNTHEALIDEAAAKRGLGCKSMAETLKTAAALDQICPSTLLPYDDALASAECFEFQAATQGQGGD